MITFYKDPGDIQDYDISFANWAAALGDTLQSFTVVAPSGITTVSSSRSGSVVKIWVDGGLSGESYTYSVSVTTVGGRTKWYKFIVEVN